MATKPAEKPVTHAPVQRTAPTLYPSYEALKARLLADQNVANRLTTALAHIVDTYAGCETLAQYAGVTKQLQNISKDLVQTINTPPRP